MRKTVVALTAVVVMTAWTVWAQDTSKPGHEMSKSAGGASNAAKIRKATSAAPSDIARGATVMDVSADGKMTELRKGTNGWMCMVNPQGDPMCMDKEWQSWADAWINKKDPQVKAVGVAYMLKGDNGASNTDPYAAKATADNQWVVSGPHIMILTPDTAQLDALPTDPHKGGPWVMWKGTKYAHIMVPTTAMPSKKTAAAAK